MGRGVFGAIRLDWRQSTEKEFFKSLERLSQEKFTKFLAVYATNRLKGLRGQVYRYLLRLTKNAHVGTYLETLHVWQHVLLWHLHILHEDHSWDKYVLKITGI